MFKSCWSFCKKQFCLATRKERMNGYERDDVLGKPSSDIEFLQDLLGKIANKLWHDYPQEIGVWFRGQVPKQIALIERYLGRQL